MASVKRTRTRQVARSTSRGRTGTNGGGRARLVRGPTLANAFAQIATQTMYIAVKRDPALLRALAAAGKHTPAFGALARGRVSPGTRAWVAKSCRRGGPVEKAIESELRIAFRRLQCDGARRGTSLEKLWVLWPEPQMMDGPCWPMCTP